MERPDHIPAPAWETALELQRTAPGKWVKDICAGAWIASDGSIDIENPGPYDCRMPDNLEGYVCHSYLSTTTTSPLIFDTQSSEKRKPSQETANRAFYEWMMTASPVRDFILNDDLSLLMDGGAVIDAQRAGVDVSLWICKAFRTMVEDMHRIPIWHQLVERGVKPLLALCTAHCVNESLLDQGSTTHCSIFKNPATAEEVKKLLSQAHLPKSSGPYKGRGETYTVFATGQYCWGNKLPLPKRGVVVKVPDGWGGYIEKIVGQDIDSLAEALLKLEKENM